MKQLKKSLKRISKTVLDVIMLAVGLIIIAFIISYGLWFAASKSPRIFSASVVILTTGIIIYMFIKKIIRKKQER
ncbi:hypothetical protein WKV44_04685 [Spirochaetia bacterium 38H-sp]|uniref:Uncharacterized protein n=1 Tax=Rarispira pelagica TaxID=3141764 RepID=A0ABU9UB00_9SPIR